MWGTPIEVERRRRILLSVWAYAYEAGQPLIDDATYDKESALVNLAIETGNKKMDSWFKENYNPYTGMWVRSHPEINKIANLVERIRAETMTSTGLTQEQRKALALKVVAHFNDHTAALYDEGPRKHLGASLIGDKCSRKLWYSFRWCLKPTYINAKGEDHKGRMMRLFNRGHKEEFRFVEWLRGMGFTVEEFQADGKTQFRISDVAGHYGGSLDGMVVFPQEYGPLPKMLLEFKTSSAKYFEKLKDGGVKQEKPTHYAQMCSYGKRYQLKYALYLCACKENDDIHSEIVELDWDFADKLTQKAAAIIMAQKPPAKLSENSAYFECKFCDFAPICHGQVRYEKNCRSCDNAVPAPDGQWQCKQFGIIPQYFIKQGCDNWQEAR
jgi:hypothetical protein